MADTTWEEFVSFDWCQVGEQVTLHALGSVDDPAAVEDQWGGEGETKCGKRGWLLIPGMFSRMGRRRCAKCCDLTGLPRGVGSPKNDPECRRILGLDDEVPA